MTPRPISPSFTRPLRRNRTIQPNARTRTEIQNGNSTPNSTTRRITGPPSTQTIDRMNAHAVATTDARRQIRSVRTKMPRICGSVAMIG